MHERVYLDPLNDHITTSSFATERQEVADKIAHYRKHPFELKLLLAICVATPVFFIGVMTGLHYFNVLIILVSLVGLLFFIFYLKELKEDVIQLLLCEKYGWAYNPTPDYDRAYRFAKLFPDIFDRGDPDLRKVDNQIWGTLGKDESIHFWSGIFHYEEKEGESELKTKYDWMKYTSFGKNDTDICDKPVFIIELHKMLPYSFSLYSYGLERDMKTESMEFNNKYRIILHDKHKDSKHHVTKVLSPSVIVRLVEFADELSIDCISFQHNCMVVLFNQEVWEPKYTNFIRKAEIDERDVHSFDKLIKHMSELPIEMRKYLQ